MKLYVECCESKDTKNVYHALKCDFGYRVAVVTMEKDICAELLGVPLAQLYKMKVGEKLFIKVGE